MKIITLNLWGGRMYQPLLDFILKNQDVDIFCFQEIYHNALGKNKWDSNGEHFDFYNEMQLLLPNHIGYFCPTVGDYYGLASFVRKNLLVLSHGEIDIYQNPEHDGRGASHSRKALWLNMQIKNTKLSIINVHGLWNGQGKIDTPERIEQSKRIRSFMDSIESFKIVCGDFNLLPETESMCILEQNMQNLIKDYKVTTTRTSLYTNSEKSGKFADYILVSNDIKIFNFNVLPDEVSDHSALLVDVEVS